MPPCNEIAIPELLLYGSFSQDKITSNATLPTGEVTAEGSLLHIPFNFQADVLK